VQALSKQSRAIGLVGAVEAGVGLWYFTNGHWINGVFYVIAVAFLFFVYIRRERKLKGPGGGRRY
jgi:membrane protein YdbS with pleckstrin-like domain